MKHVYDKREDSANFGQDEERRTRETREISSALEKGQDIAPILARRTQPAVVAASVGGGVAAVAVTAAALSGVGIPVALGIGLLAGLTSGGVTKLALGSGKSQLSFGSGDLQTEKDGSVVPTEPIPVEKWSQVKLHNGDTFLVSPDYISPVGIGEAELLAAKYHAEVPTPELVDAIWKAADLKILPVPMNHDGSFKGMNGIDIITRHRKHIEDEVGGKDFSILAGSHKDIVKKNNHFGIYGWHVSDAEASSFTKKTAIPLHAPETPNLGGKIIQQFPSPHDKSWKDYSQGLRLVKRVIGGGTTENA